MIESFINSIKLWFYLAGLYVSTFIKAVVRG